MSVSVSSDSDSHRRKRLRKGTHSCEQCRRRKVRCIFEPNSQRCDNCIAREAPCTQQGIGRQRQRSSENQKSTRRRLEEVEGVLGQILERLPAKPTASLTHRESEQTGIGTSLRSANYELPSPSAQQATFPPRPFSKSSALAAAARHFDTSFTQNQSHGDAPLLSLFDNSFLSRELDQRDGDRAVNPAVADRTHCRILKDTNTRLLRDLKNLVPNVHDLTLILRYSLDSWRLWHQVFSEDLGTRAAGSEDTEVGALRDFIYKSLNTDDVAIVTKVILCLTMHLQQLPRDFDFSDSNLPASSETLQDYYMKAVEIFLEPDDGVVETVEGVECLMIQAEFYVNVGKPKKIWSIFRRAVSCAQLLGLHHQSDDLTVDLASRRKALWSQIWQSERELSLVLGLPYAVSEAFLPSWTAATDQIEQTFLAQLGIIAGHIIERNQNLRQMTYHITQKIDQELEGCKDLMPDRWWEMTPGLHMSRDATFTMSVVKMKYHNVRKLLHLPFMLKSYTDLRYDSSRLICLESAREMIKVYRTMRDEKRPVLKMCDMMDFQAFTAAMVLVVDLLGHSQFSAHYHPQQEASDWETVRSITQDFKRVSKIMVCSSAEQSAHLLEDFYAAHHVNPAPEKTTYEAVIPYFGSLRIVRDQGAVPLMTPANAALEPQTRADPSENYFEANAQPFVSFDECFQTLPGTFQPCQELEAGWASNLALGDDWSWFPHGHGSSVSDL